jgi:preprotein translocase subunit SecG
MKEQNAKVLTTITVILAVAFLAAGLIVIPAIEQHQRAEAAGCPPAMWSMQVNDAVFIRS